MAILFLEVDTNNITCTYAKKKTKLNQDFRKEFLHCGTYKRVPIKFLLCFLEFVKYYYVNCKLYYNVQCFQQCFLTCIILSDNINKIYYNTDKPF